MLRKDIDKIFTQEVAEYIGKGYTICPATAHGDGRDCKVDLYKGDDFVRIRMRRRSSFEGGHDVTITVYRLHEKLDTLEFGEVHDDWLELVDKKRFKLVTGNWFVTMDEWLPIVEKREKRSRWNDGYYFPFSENAKKAALPLIRRQRYGKDVHAEDITKLFKYAGSFGPEYIAVVNDSEIFNLKCKEG